MRVPGPHRCSLLACGTLGLVVYALTFPTAAHGECGDYVTVDRGTQQTAAKPAENSAMPDAPHPAPQPGCHGPGCSVPPSPTTTTPTPKPIERPGLDLPPPDSASETDSRSERVVTSHKSFTAT